MTDFTIEEVARGDAVALTLGGELDMSATFVLEPVLDRVLAGSPSELVLDLANVSFVDSSGLGLLIATNERTRDADVAMAITGAGPEVQRVFQLAGLDDVLPLRG